MSKSKSKTEEQTTVVTPPVVAEAAAPTEQVLVAFSDKGKAHEFRAGSQRDVWFQSLRAYEGKPLNEWLVAVAEKIPAQRAKEGAKTPHKGGMGFLRRFALEGLLAEGVYKG
jgi:hypothetical protein